MAYTKRIYHAQLYADSIEIASRKLRRVIDEVHDGTTLAASRGPYATGRLASSIYKEGPVPLGQSVVGRVGSRLSYAAAVEHGAKIHDIFPRGAPHVYRFGRGAGPPQLKFFWRKAGRIVYMPQIPGSPSKIGISHPGQKGKGFLIKPLARAAIRHRMRIIVYDV